MTIAQGEEANEWQLSLVMENSTPFVALSFNLQLPKGIKIKEGMKGIVPTERLASHALVAAEYMEKNQWQMMVYSPQNDYISANEGSILTITLIADDNVAMGKNKVYIAEIVGVNGNGMEHSMDGNEVSFNIDQTGIDTVNNGECKVSYFTPDGLPISQPQNGMVIGRKIHADGKVEVQKFFMGQ